jgi:hypothetical protein
MNFAFPPFFLLIPYGLILAVIAFFSLVNISHLLRYGPRLSGGAFLSVFYLIGVCLLVYATYQLLPMVNWTDPLNFSIPLPTL